jgi:predicted HicB family RNase H-like nuclease
MKSEKNNIGEEELVKDPEYYLALPYKRIIFPTGELGDTAYFAEVLELEGCCAEGATYSDAYEALTRKMTIHIQMFLNRGLAPPMPKMPMEYSGKVLVRMPATLHYKLMLRAKEENVSVNQLIVSKLSLGEVV